MKPEKAFEAVDTLIEGMTDAEQARLFDHLRTAYLQELGAQALNGAGA